MPALAEESLDDRQMLAQPQRDPAGARSSGFVERPLSKIVDRGARLDRDDAFRDAFDDRLDVRKATRVPRSDDRIAKASARADFPLPTSPPRTTKSPRRNPPPSDLSMLGKPHESVSRGGDPSLTASTRDNRTESGEMSVLRVIGHNTLR